MSKERPILMNGSMVRAVLDGSKTQTRRIVKQLDPREGAVTTGGNGQPMAACWAYGGPAIPCPYGVPGEHLWVRETWYCDDYRIQSGPYFEVDGARELLAYRADGERPYEAEQPVWRPSIHMPRWASRILLEIASVRVERLQDISDVDIEAEGIDMDALAEAQDRYDAIAKDDNASGRATLRTAWRDLWESTGGDWGANPWCWVISFKRVTP